MAVLRSDIERALNDLISHEEGMKFQSLATVLAKKRWPDLVACEHKKDLGADALAKASFASDGKGKVLACSITAALKKIRDDAETVKKQFREISQLIFATPAQVSNQTGEAWAAEIEREFGYELAIMSREEFITSLMDPSNAALLSSHLGLVVEVEENLAELIGKARAAAAEVVSAWSMRIAGRHLLRLRALRLAPDGRDSSELLELDAIRAALSQSRRFVLEGSAGRGKTTTLIQLASLPGAAEGTSFLVDLPAWMASGSGILEFIAGMPPFQSRGLDAGRLAQVSAAEHFSFLLNGWNEISELEFHRADNALRVLEREFPSAGIIVATRNHHIAPPLPGAMRARLLPVTRRERAAYLRARIGVRADDLRAKLDGDPVLDDLTRTPFFLAEVTSIFESGVNIPSTRVGVLEAVTRLSEQSAEHRNDLQLPPLAGRASDYLRELAMRMTARGGVSIPEDDARAAVAAVGRLLQAAGQVGTAPEPAEALGALCAHHVLDRQDYPAVGFRFQHQRFQEFYAVAEIQKRLLEVLSCGDEGRKREFTKLYVNEPAWAECLRLIADDIRGRSEGARSPDVIRAGIQLVEMALGVDVVFAAELAHLCGQHVWQEVRGNVGARLRSLHASPEDHFRRYALAGMLASGSDDFKDIIEPLLSSEDEQVRLRTYRRRDEFYVSSVGAGWRDTVGAWREDARVTFVSEILHHRNIPEVAAFALADPSIKVKEAAVQGLCWRGAEDDVAQFLAALDAPTFDTIVLRFDPDFIPASLRDRVIPLLQAEHGSVANPVARLTISLKLAALGTTDFVEQLKDDLGRIAGTMEAHHVQLIIKPALDIVRERDAAWVSAWVVERIAAGSLWHDHWRSMLTVLPEGLKEGLLTRLESEDFGHARVESVVALLATGADVVTAERIFLKLCELRRTITEAPDERHEFEWAVARQLEALWRAFPANISVTALLERFSKPVDAVELGLITRVFSGVGRSEGDLRGELDAALRESFRAYLKRAVAFALRQDDFSGELKANVGSVLASVGAAEDMAEMRALVQADIERVRRGQAARARGDRGKLGNGASMSYADWHVRAVVRLDAANSEGVLIDLLGEPEYERSVAAELARQAVQQSAREGLLRKIDYGRIWEARAGRREEPDRARRERYAAALRNRIDTISREGVDARKERFRDARLKQLAVALAAIDSHGSADVVFKVMSVPDEWSDHQRVSAFEALLFNGVALPAEGTIAVVDSAVERWRKSGRQQQDEWLVTRALCLLPFVDDPVRGFAKLRAIISEFRIYNHQLRDVVAAVGHCRSDQALAFLRDIGSDRSRVAQILDAWVNAVAALDCPESWNLLLGFVDPDLPGLPLEFGSFGDDVLVTRIVELIRRDKNVEQRLFRLCEAQLPPGERMLLAKIVGRLGELAAVSAALRLIDDTLNPPVPFEISRQLEAAFVERVPYGNGGNTFTLEPRSSNAIRAKLLEVASSDKRRKRSALMLLGQIEEWRLEYGRPVGEPRHPAFESGGHWPPVA